MRKPPPHIHNAEVLCYSFIDERQKPTGKCIHEVNGERIGPASGLAVCKYENDSEVILYYCDENWRPMTHSHRPTVEEAKIQAAFEYEGVENTWEVLSGGVVEP